MMRSMYLAAAGLFMTLAMPATADDGKDLLDAFLTDVTTLSARFDQQLVDADGVVVEESTGNLQISRPGRFRWTYETPYEQVMVADGLNVWHHDIDLEQVTVNDQKEILGNTPALLLGGTDNLYDDFEFVAEEADRGTVWVELRPKSTDNGFTKVELGFNEGELRRLIFSDNLQQSTLIVLYDLVTNSELDETLFSFEPPAGADLVGEPVVAVDY